MRNLKTKHQTLVVIYSQYIPKRKRLSRDQDPLKYWQVNSKKLREMSDRMIKLSGYFF